MNCEKIQEFIITDYIDAQLENRPKSLIDQHMTYCHACKDFLISVKKEAVGPFNNAPRAVPDGFLWSQIKQAIEEDQRQQIEKNFIPDFWERLRSAVHIPRPAFALATMVTMIFMVGTTGQLFFSSQAVKINGQDQIEYLSYLIDEPVDANNGNDSQTLIEKYFL